MQLVAPVISGVGIARWAVRAWCALGIVAGCADSGDRAGADKQALTVDVWAHSGQEAERDTIQHQVSEFNRSQNSVKVQLTQIPELSYNGQVQAAALAGDLPCLLDFDGPYLYNYVWQGKLVPLDPLLCEETRADLLPSIVDQGSYRGRLYAVGTFDSGLGLYARLSALKSVGARIPDAPAKAWRAAELDQILTALAATDPDHKVLDLKLNYQGEWFSYGFSPALQSAGADLIDRRGYQTAQGALNSPAAAIAMGYFQRWAKQGLVDANLDDAAFTTGRVPLSWVGHWEYRRYAKAWGSDLVVLPLPDFGRGSRSGQGSWSWGITTSCAHPRAAARFVAFLLTPAQVIAMADANGAVPGTLSAISRSRVYGPKGPLHLFADQLRTGITVPRPKTPAYPIISSVFERTFHRILDGDDIQSALDAAVAAVDQDIRDNLGYPITETQK